MAFWGWVACTSLIFSAILQPAISDCTDQICKHCDYDAAVGSVIADNEDCIISNGICECATRDNDPRLKDIKIFLDGVKQDLSPAFNRNLFAYDANIISYEADENNVWQNGNPDGDENEDQKEDQDEGEYEEELYLFLELISTYPGQEVVVYSHDILSGEEKVLGGEIDDDDTYDIEFEVPPGKLHGLELRVVVHSADDSHSLEYTIIIKHDPQDRTQNGELSEAIEYFEYSCPDMPERREHLNIDNEQKQVSHNITLPSTCNKLSVNLELNSCIYVELWGQRTNTPVCDSISQTVDLITDDIYLRISLDSDMENVITYVIHLIRCDDCFGTPGLTSQPTADPDPDPTAESTLHPSPITESEMVESIDTLSPSLHCNGAEDDGNYGCEACDVSICDNGHWRRDEICSAGTHCVKGECIPGNCTEIRLTRPKNYEVWRAGKTHNFTWEPASDATDHSFEAIDLMIFIGKKTDNEYFNETSPFALSKYFSKSLKETALVHDARELSEVTLEGTANDGDYSWEIPEDQEPAHYFVVVTTNDDTQSIKAYTENLSIRKPKFELSEAGKLGAGVAIITGTIVLFMVVIFSPKLKRGARGFSNYSSGADIASEQESGSDALDLNITRTTDLTETTMNTRTTSSNASNSLRMPQSMAVIQQPLLDEDMDSGDDFASDKSRPWKCQQCGKRFTRKGNLTVHVKNHSGIRKFACQMCSKRFAKKQNLQNHMRTHTKEKPFRCALCGKCFSRRCNLTRHGRTHLGIRPFPCPYCVRRFADKSNFAKHIKKIHPERPRVQAVSDGAHMLAALQSVPPQVDASDRSLAYSPPPQMMFQTLQGMQQGPQPVQALGQISSQAAYDFQSMQNIVPKQETPQEAQEDIKPNTNLGVEQNKLSGQMFHPYSQQQVIHSRFTPSDPQPVDSPRSGRRYSSQDYQSAYWSSKPYPPQRQDSTHSNSSTAEFKYPNDGGTGTNAQSSSSALSFSFKNLYSGGKMQIKSEPSIVPLPSSPTSSSSSSSSPSKNHSNGHSRTISNVRPKSGTLSDRMKLKTESALDNREFDAEFPAVNFPSEDLSAPSNVLDMLSDETDSDTQHLSELSSGNASPTLSPKQHARGDSGPNLPTLEEEAQPFQSDWSGLELKSEYKPQLVNTYDILGDGERENIDFLSPPKLETIKMIPKHPIDSYLGYSAKMFNTSQFPFASTDKRSAKKKRKHSDSFSRQSISSSTSLTGGSTHSHTTEALQADGELNFSSFGSRPSISELPNFSFGGSASTAQTFASMSSGSGLGVMAGPAPDRDFENDIQMSGITLNGQQGQKRSSMSSDSPFSPKVRLLQKSSFKSESSEDYISIV